MYEDVERSKAYVVCIEKTPNTGAELILENEPVNEDSILSVGLNSRARAIIGSGASENIIGEDTLQDLADYYEELEFDAQAEISVDRQIHKQFTFGNNQTSSGLGLAHVKTGLCGQEVEVQTHLVEGATPFLFLYGMEATINFRTGIAVFKKLSDQHFQLERSSSNHLMIPTVAFAGR